MSFDAMFNFVPAFTLAFFRLTGLMLMSPLFGSAKIPKRIKVLFASVATMTMVSSVPTAVDFPPTLLQLAIAIAGEMMFGLAMGTIVSFVFIAATWAGEMIGQQIGFNLGETFDPQYGGGGSLVSDMYSMLCLIVFFSVGGDRTMLRAVHESFRTVPLLSLGVDRPLWDTMMDLFNGATLLAMRLAAPMFFTMLIVDLVMGCIGRAMPQMNIMSAGLPVRSILGILVLAVTVVLTGAAIRTSLVGDLDLVFDYFRRGTAHG